MVPNEKQIMVIYLEINHGLRKINEGINQRNLKIWADVADKIGFGHT
jgi:hypothetical protein